MVAVVMGESLIQELNRRKESLKLTNERFCRLIGVHISVWNKAKIGEYRFNEAHLESILRAFPETSTLVFNYVRETGSQKLAGSVPA